jgi:hypothetical protein
MTNHQEATRMADEAMRLVEEIKPKLAGLAPELQGAVLADLLAMWLAGHFAGDAEATARLRRTMLAEHLKTVSGLVEPNEAMLLERLKRQS